MRTAVLAFVTAACASTPSPHSPRQSNWQRQSFERRHETMTFVVLPTMARRFQAFQGHPAPDLSCESCHGANALERHYQMPATLPPLPRDVLSRPPPSDPKGVNTMAFMRDIVTPTMRQLLDVGPNEFSCFSCHPTAEQAQ